MDFSVFAFNKFLDDKKSKDVTEVAAVEEETPKEAMVKESKTTKKLAQKK